jgi:hypothetical protein
MNLTCRRKHRADADEVVAHVADLLMTLALDFENGHLAEILRHRRRSRPEEATPADPRQLSLFPELPPF